VPGITIQVTNRKRLSDECVTGDLSKFAGKHRSASTVSPEQNVSPKLSVKNYMSDKIGAADSGIITIDQPAGLARENII
jgi:hypothetical protein